MGKARVIQHLGDGQYEIEILSDWHRPPEKVEYYSEIAADILANTIPDAQAAVSAQEPIVSGLQAQVDSLSSLWQTAQDTWLTSVYELHEIDLALADPDLGPEERASLKADQTLKKAEVNTNLKAKDDAYEDVMSKLSETAAEAIVLRDLEVVLDEAKGAYAAALKNQALWEEREEPETPRTETVWCADLSDGKYSDVIPDDTIVGLWAADRVDGDIGVLPAYSSGLVSQYDSAQHGQLQHTKAADENGWMVNLMLYPGATKWRDVHGLAKILSTDPDTDTCSIVRILSDGSKNALPLSAAWDDGSINSTVYNDVPVEYMDCNVKAFNEGDEVVVEFNPDTGLPVKVIGFRSNPRPCIPELAFQFFNEVTKKFPIISYDPDTKEWSRSDPDPNSASCGQQQWMRGLDLVSVTNLSVSALWGQSRSVFWNRVDQGSPTSSSWDNVFAWLDEDDRLICFSTYTDIDAEPAAQYGWAISVKPLAGSWSTIHQVGPADQVYAERYPNINGGVWVDPSDGKTVILNGNAAFATISGGSVKYTLTIGVSSVGVTRVLTETTEDTWNSDSHKCDSGNTAEMIYGDININYERNFTGGQWMEVNLGSTGSPTYHLLESKHTINEMRTSRTSKNNPAPWSRASEYSETGEGKPNGLSITTTTMNYSYDYGECSGADANTDDEYAICGTRSVDDRTYSVSRDHYSSVANGYVETEIKGQYSVSNTGYDDQYTVIVNGEPVFQIPFTGAAPQQITEDVNLLVSCTGFGGEPFDVKYWSGCALSYFSTKSGLSVHPTGAFAWLFAHNHSGANSGRPDRDYQNGLYISGRGLSNDLLPDYEDCYLHGLLDGYVEPTA